MSRLLKLLYSPIDNASLVFFRIYFALIMLWEVWRYLESDWVFSHYIATRFHFTYYGFSWVRPWGDAMMYAHFLAMGACAFFILIGLFYRVSALLFFLLFTYVFLLDQAYYLNHFYLVSLVSFTMILLPAHQSCSLDAILRPGIRSEVAPAWTIWCPRLLLAIVYFYAGVAKLNGDWLAGEPVRMWLAQHKDATLLGPILPIGTLLTQEWFVYGFAYGGLLFDLLIVPLLLWRRTRLIGYAWCLAFHLTNAWLFHIGIFPWFMIGATLLFLEPDWPRRVLNWPRKDPSPKLVPPAVPIRRLTLGFWAMFLALQLLIPLRHFLYPGIVHWTEEGHRFAWHMKLRDKSATAEIRVTDQDSGEMWKVDPRKYLNSRQQRKMSSRPDMLLQFCHHLAREYRTKGYPNVQVHATVYCALNGRIPQLLVDDKIDLASQKRNLRPAKWIVPLRTPLKQSPRILDGNQ